MTVALSACVLIFMPDFKLRGYALMYDGKDDGKKVWVQKYFIFKQVFII